MKNRITLKDLAVADAEIVAQRDDELKRVAQQYEDRKTNLAENRRVVAILDSLIPDSVEMTGSDKYSTTPYIQIRFRNVVDRERRAVFTQVMKDLRREIGPMLVSWRGVADARKRLVDIHMTFKDERLSGCITITYTDRVPKTAKCKIVKVEQPKRQPRKAEYTLVCER